MMWQFFHWLFGWHYVSVQTCLGDQHIRLVRHLPTGEPYIKLYGGLAVLESDGTFDRIRTPVGGLRWRALTFDWYQVRAQ